MLLFVKGDNMNFERPLKVWTDGSCIVQQKVGGWAIVSKDFQESGPVIGTTNNEMELYAIYKAVKKYGEYDSIEVYSDSQYAINTLTNWAYTWKANGWKKKGGIKNLQLIQLIFEIVENNDDIHFHYVRGHNGDEMNEEADKLAKAAARSALQIMLE